MVHSVILLWLRSKIDYLEALKNPRGGLCVCEIVGDLDLTLIYYNDWLKLKSTMSILTFIIAINVELETVLSVLSEIPISNWTACIELENRFIVCHLLVLMLFNLSFSFILLLMFDEIQNAIQ